MPNYYIPRSKRELLEVLGQKYNLKGLKSKSKSQLYAIWYKILENHEKKLIK